MPKNKLAFAVQLVVIALLFVSCKKNASDGSRSGSFDKNIYHNQYFGMTVTVPPDWVIQSKEEVERLKRVGTKALAGDDKSMESSLKAADDGGTLSLFSVMEFPAGSPVGFNPSISSVAADVSHLPGIKSGKDYQFQLKAILESGAIDVDFPNHGETYVRKLGGVDFDVLDVEMRIRKLVIKQKYFSAIMKGYALCFIVTGNNDEQQASLDKIMETVSFSQP